MPVCPAIGGLARNDSVGSLAALAAEGSQQSSAGDGELLSATVGPPHSAVRVTEASIALVLSGGALTSVDLSPLRRIARPKKEPAYASGPALREISLASNSFRTVDLSPLTLLPSLAVLTLNSNALASVDLKPLASCPSLERLWLHRNSLTFIDLAPLEECHLLRSLYLDSNRIDEVSVDLTPLAHCRLLRSLRLTGNKLNGSLDLTPLLNCSNLSSFDVSSSVTLYADAGASGGAADTINSLPPAIRKRNEAVHWRNSRSPPPSPDEKKIRSEPSVSISQPGLQALLLNYGMADFYKMRELLAKQGGINSTGVADVLYERDGMHRYDVALIHITDKVAAEQCVQEITAISKNLPIVVVGSSAVSDAGSACIRRGATLFLAEPLCARDAIAIRNLAQKDVQKTSERGDEGPVALPAVEAVLDRPKTRLVVPALKRLRPISPHRTGVGSPARNKMEYSALEKLFVRSGGSVDIRHFTPMATLSGLPSCAAPLLFRACAEHGNADVSEPMRKETFVSFWDSRLRNRDAEGRMFEVMLSSEKNRLVHPDAFYDLAEGLLKSVRNRLPEMPRMQEAIALGILYGLTGQASSRRPVLEREVRRANFCSRILACESGVYEGFIAFLRPDRFAQIYSVFRTARANALGDIVSMREAPKSELGQPQMINFCRDRSLLFPRSVESIFAHQIWTNWDEEPRCDRRLMSMPDFVVAWLAMTDVATKSAADYWFSVMDCDKDGHISAFDAAHFFIEKERTLLGDGLILAPFCEVWTCILDICGPQDPRRGPTLSDLKRLSEKNREFVIKALLFRDDGNVVIDIRKTMAVSEGDGAVCG